MIRGKKRLVKRMPGGVTNYGDVFLSSLISEYERRIADLEYELELDQTPEHRVCGGYRIVGEEEYEGLKNRVAINDRKCEIYEQTIDAKDGRIADLNATLKLACKMSDEFRAKLSLAENLNESFTYDKETVDRFDPKTPSELADYVQFTLDCGGKTSFAGACLALIKRELDKTIASMNKFPTPDNSPPKSGKYVSNFPILTSGKVISSMKLPNGYYVYDIEFPETCNGASGSCNNGR